MMLPMSSHWNILDNRIIIVSFGAWLAAQTIKFLINLFQTKRLEWGYMISSGNMPSAHCALVSALAMSVAISEGLDSVLFAIAAGLAMIVIYDAAGVRRTVGIQSTILNRMLDELFKGNPIVSQRLREFIGHSRMEVVAGVALGMLMGFLAFIGEPKA